jgi:hypothetical protein
MPFIIGLPSDRFREVRDMSSSVIVVDLDNNLITLDEEQPLPALPHRQEVKLRKDLKKFADANGHRDVQWSSVVLPSRDLAFKFALRPCDDDVAPGGV